MSTAAKHRRRAAEFEQLKQVDRAIALYVKAIEASEADGEDVDVALLNKVGDLSLRQGQIPEAITYYERAVDHYTATGLYNNAIALCNKILRSAPGRSVVYFTLGRICAKKGLRGDATRNFLAYASRMQLEGKVDEGMRALAEVADLMPELTEVRALVDEHAARKGIPLSRREVPPAPAPEPVSADPPPTNRFEKTKDLVFLELDYRDPRLRTPLMNRAVVPPPEPRAATPAAESSTEIEPVPLDSVDVVPMAGLEGVADHLQPASPDPVVPPKPPAPPPQAPVVLEPIDLTEELSTLPGVDAAIKAGADLVDKAEAAVTPVDPASGGGWTSSARPPFRIDPHDFILPGELPPLVLDDAVIASVPLQVRPTPRAVDAIPSAPRRVPTPSIPMAAVVAEAAAVASSRLDDLRRAVLGTPSDWRLRRRYAEALFESGAREDAIRELQSALDGFSALGDLPQACEITDELVLVSPDRIPFHQKRVELAVQRKEPARLRTAYLDLADALVRLNEAERAHAVYARVLELDPFDGRARAALGVAAPPIPVPLPAQATAEYVDLAAAVSDAVEESTRIRMREPLVTGDEQADFALLLRHFKEGVARSLGDDDFSTHYDLGVAYKEMGLIDDAVEEFQKALRSRVHRPAAYEALGQCFIEQERYDVAATVLVRALHEPGLDDQHRIGLLYLLAYSAEAQDRIDEARGYYQRVHAINPNFRDVAARLGALGTARQ
jgi:tetratricopeptide (TPR) repeat protein